MKEKVTDGMFFKRLMRGETIKVDGEYDVPGAFDLADAAAKACPVPVLRKRLGLVFEWYCEPEALATWQAERESQLSLTSGEVKIAVGALAELAASSGLSSAEKEVFLKLSRFLGVRRAS